MAVPFNIVEDPNPDWLSAAGLTAPAATRAPVPSSPQRAPGSPFVYEDPNPDWLQGMEAVAGAAAGFQNAPAEVVPTEAPPDPGTPMLERVGRDVAAGAMRGATDMGAFLAGGMAQIPQYAGAGQALAQKMAEYDAWIQQNVAPPEQGFGDELAQAAGNMLTLLIPGVGVAGTVGKGLSAAAKLDRGARFLTVLGRLGKAGKALDAAGQIARGARIVGGAAGSVAMSGLEAGMETGGTVLAKMAEGEDAATAGRESNKVFWENLLVLIPTNYGYFHPISRFARALLEIPFEGGQEAIQQMIQNDALGRPLLEGVPRAAAIGAILGAGAGAVLPGEGRRPEARQDRQRARREGLTAAPAPEGFEYEDEGATGQEAETAPALAPVVEGPAPVAAPVLSEPLATSSPAVAEPVDAEAPTAPANPSVAVAAESAPAEAPIEDVTEFRRENIQEALDDALAVVADPTAPSQVRADAQNVAYEARDQLKRLEAKPATPAAEGAAKIAEAAAPTKKQSPAAEGAAKIRAAVEPESPGEKLTISYGSTKIGEATVPKAEGPRLGKRESEIVSISDLNINTEAFQNREAPYSEDSVKKITEKFDRDKLEDIDTWVDPETGKRWVIEGHSRLEALKRLGYKEAPIHDIDAKTFDEAKKRAQEANYAKDRPSAVDSANLLRKAKAGERLTNAQVRERARSLLGKDAQAALDLMSLHPEGKTLDVLRSTKKAGDINNAELLTRARWVGQTLARYPEMTAAHERELFDYLEQTYKQKPWTNSAQAFQSWIDGMVRKRAPLMGEFDATQPLNLKDAQRMSQAEERWNEAVAEATAAVDEARAVRTAKMREFLAQVRKDEQKPTATPFTESMIPKAIKPYEEALQIAEVELEKVREREGFAKTEGGIEPTLFGGFGGFQLFEGPMNRAAWRLRERLATFRERQARSPIDERDSPEMVRRVNDTYKTMREMRQERRKGVRRVYREFYKKHVSDSALYYDSLNDALGDRGVDYDALPAGEKPEWALRFAKAASGRAMGFIEHGVRDPLDPSKRWSKGLREIIADHKLVKRWDQFNAYLAARARKDRISREMNQGVSDERGSYLEDMLADDEAIIEQYGQEFEAAAKEVTQFTQAVLRYAVECGAMDRALYNKLLETYPNYSPLNLLTKLDEISPSGRGTQQNLPKAVKRAGAVEDEVVVPPIWQIQKNTYYIIQLAEANRARRAHVELHEQFAGTGLARRLKPNAGLRMAPTWSTVEDFLKAAGLNAKAITEVQQQTGMTTEDLDTYRALWKIAHRQPPGVLSVGREVDVLDEEGKKTGEKKWELQYWKVDEDTYEAFTSMGKMHALEALRIFSAQTRFLRAGATLTADFAARNWIRDAVGAGVLAKDAINHPFAMAKALAHVVKQDEVFRQWVASGGALAESYAMDINALEKAEADLLRASTAGRVFYRLKHPIQGLRFLSSVSERTTRVGVFEQTLKKNLARAARGEMSVYDAYVGAAMESREASIDFNRAGEYGRVYNSFFAFYNASVQGMDKFNRTFFVDNGKGKAWLKGISMITLPTLALWALNHDEDWYKELDPYLKNSFWWMSFDGGKTKFFWPKPFEVGMVFASLPERMMDFLFDNRPREMKHWAERMKDQLNPLQTPLPVIKAGYEAFLVGRDLRLDRPIVPRGLENVQARYQYDENTTEFAKVLGDIMPGKGVSPKKIDFFIRGASGGLGRYAEDLVSTAIILLDPKREREVPERQKGLIPVLNVHLRADLPLVRSFIKVGPSRNTQTLEDFYEFLEESQESVDTLNSLARRGRGREDIPDLIREHGFWLVVAENLEDRGRKLAKINARIHALDADDGTLGTPAARRREIDELVTMRQQIASQAVEWVNGLRSSPEAMTDALDAAAERVENALQREQGRRKLLQGD